MIKLSKKVEYAILAMHYMVKKGNEPVSAKEIAENLKISFEFLSKTLQALMKSGLVISQQGTKGGYYTARKANQISIADIMDAMSEKPGIVECIHDGKTEDPLNCRRSDDCSLKSPMMKIQKEINEIFTRTTLDDIPSGNFIDFPSGLYIRGENV